jgi:hypothetical protein
MPTPKGAAIRTGPSVATIASQPSMPSVNSVAGTRTAALAITRRLVQGFRSGAFCVTLKNRNALEAVAEDDALSSHARMVGAEGEACLLSTSTAFFDGLPLCPIRP